MPERCLCRRAWHFSFERGKTSLYRYCRYPQVPCRNGHGLRQLSGSTSAWPIPPQMAHRAIPCSGLRTGQNCSPKLAYLPSVPRLIMSEDIPGACACIVSTYAMKAAGKRFRDLHKTTYRERISPKKIIMNNKLASIKIFSWEFIWLLFCGFMTIVWVSEVWNVKTAPEQYACLWGGEGPVAQLWYYASENLYLLHLACLIVWFMSGIWLCVCRWSLKRALLLAHVCLSMLWLTAALITIC